MDGHACVVLLSGGQDSTTCLAWAQQHWERVEALCFDYGQRHRIELQAAKRIAAMAGVPFSLLPCDSFTALGGNALTGDEAVDEALPTADALPNTFVPGRNLIFLGLAAAFAWQRGISDLVTGVCETDYSGYPDCREATMESLAQTLSLGLDTPMRIHTPLMHLDKAATVRLAADLGALSLLAESHTCYQGHVPPCGCCPACRLRAKGFAEAGVADPLLNRPG